MIFGDQVTCYSHNALQSSHEITALENMFI